MSLKQLVTAEELWDVPNVLGSQLRPAPVRVRHRADDHAHPGDVDTADRGHLLAFVDR